MTQLGLNKITEMAEDESQLESSSDNESDSESSDSGSTVVTENIDKVRLPINKQIASRL